MSQLILIGCTERFRMTLQSLKTNVSKSGDIAALQSTYVEPRHDDFLSMTCLGLEPDDVVSHPAFLRVNNQWLAICRSLSGLRVQ